MKRLLLCLLPLFALAQDPNEVNLANEYFLDGEYERAIPLYEKLHKQNPPVHLYITRIVESHMNLEQPDEALDFIDKVTKKDKHPILTALKGYVYQQRLEKDAAQESWKEAIDACKQENDYRALGNYFLSIREYTQAESTYLEGREKMGGPARFALELSYVYRYQNDLTKATKSLIDFYQAQPHQAAMVRSQILSMAGQPANQDAVEAGMLQKLQDIPNDRELTQWLYEFYVQTENYEEALRQAKALDKRFNEQGKRLYSLAITLQNNEEYALSNQALKVILDEQKLSPYYIQSLTQQAKNLELLAFEARPLDTASLREAVANYDLLLKRYGRNTQMREVIYRKARLCAFYLQQQEVALQELAFIEQLPIAPADKAEARLLLGDVLLMRGDKLKAEIQYKQVLEDFKEDQIGAMARFRQARLDYFIGNFEDAKAYLKVLKERTTNNIANDAIRLYLVIQDNTGLDTTTTALERFAHAELLAYQGMHQEALDIMDSILFAYPSHELTDDIFFVKAETFLSLGYQEKGMDFLERVLAEFPESIHADDALFAKAEIFHYQLKKLDVAQKLYLDLLIKYPSSLYKVEARKRIRQLRGEKVG